MAVETIVGRDDFTEQPKRRVWRQGEGWRTIRTWIGPQDLATGKESEVRILNPAPDTITTTLGVPCVIEAEFGDAGGQEIPEIQDESDATWELIGSDLEKPIETHGYYNKSDSSPEKIEHINDAIRRGKARATNWDTEYPGMNAQSFADHKLRGIDSYVSFAYIIRKTIVTKYFTSLKIDSASAGKIIAYSAIGVPSKAKFSRPRIHRYNRNSSAWEDFDINEWMIKAPSVTWVRSRRVWTLAQEWWGAEFWSSALYDGGTYTP